MARTLGTHKLQHPIVLTIVDGEGKEKEEELRPAGFCVVVRRPKAKDIAIMDDYDKRDVTGTIAMLVRVTQLDAIEADNLDGEDFTALSELLGKAAKSGPKTGETSSET